MVEKKGTPDTILGQISGPELTGPAASMTALCNERPSKATENPVGGKACSSTKGGLLRYIPNTYSNHKVSSF